MLAAAAAPVLKAAISEEAVEKTGLGLWVTVGAGVNVVVGQAATAVGAVGGTNRALQYVGRSAQTRMKVGQGETGSANGGDQSLRSCRPVQVLTCSNWGFSLYFGRTPSRWWPGVVVDSELARRSRRQRQ
jgi:hypothetical protein